MGSGGFTFGNRADLNKVAALMKVVEQVRRGDVDKATATCESAGLSSGLLETLKAMGEDEAGFLNQLVGQLESEMLYDEYNPRLYYL